MMKLDKRGSISIYTILWLALLFPLLMFVTIDVSYYMQQNNRLKSITDNASGAGVLYIDKDEIPYGKLVINESEAEKAVLDVIKRDVLLNEDLSPAQHSVMAKAPIISVQVINDVPEAGIEVTTPQGNIKIKNPSVITCVEYPIRGLFYNKSVIRLKKIGVSQVQFKDTSK